jgi:hypothetical protein
MPFSLLLPTLRKLYDRDSVHYSFLFKSSAIIMKRSGQSMWYTISSRIIDIHCSFLPLSFNRSLLTRTHSHRKTHGPSNLAYITTLLSQRRIVHSLGCFGPWLHFYRHRTQVFE